MKILAIDTSSNACSAVLLEGDQQDSACIERFEIAPRQHTQLILPMIDSVLHEADYDIKQMDVLAFGRGPGAFTGVRVATGVIQAISYGADLPVAQISSLAALAQGFYRAQGYQPAQGCCEQNNKILVASDARMAEIYFAAYEMRDGFMTLTGAEQVLKPQKLGALLEQTIQLDKNWSTVGSGWSVYHEQLLPIANQCGSMSAEGELSDKFYYPHAKDIAYLALKEVLNKTLVSAEQVSPVYLRDNVAKKSTKQL